MRIFDTISLSGVRHPRNLDTRWYHHTCNIVWLSCPYNLGHGWMERGSTGRSIFTIKLRQVTFPIWDGGKVSWVSWLWVRFRWHNFEELKALESGWCCGNARMEPWAILSGWEIGESLKINLRRTHLRIAGNLTNEFELRSWRLETRGEEKPRRNQMTRHAASLAWSPSFRTDHPMIRVSSTWRWTSFGSSCSLSSSSSFRRPPIRSP